MRNSRGVNSNSGTIKCSYPSSTDEGSPNDLSSSHFLHLDKTSDELGQSHLSTFSIRDYAFSNRTKNIHKSWPFSSTSLQLCLKHGLSDPLPPIQPPEVSSSKKPTKTRVETISCKRKLERLGSNHHASAETTKQGFENGSKSKTQVTMLNKTPRKKCGLVVKPGACVDIAPKEDQGCLFSASESMALRTCPICKTFSSASNTTLNAHIDQCLSVDSGKQPVSKPNKPRNNKPRLKVKTMVDIYASAKGCTLEELDRRNGTKWAVISSYSNQVVSDNNNKPEVSYKEKKLAAGVGPVYIDAKGQKLRIISEVNEKASSGPSREHETVNEKKNVSGGKGSYRSCKKRLEGNASEMYRRGYSEECRGMERSETPGTSQHRMLRKHSLSRNGSKKDRGICENGHSLSEDPLVLRGPSHVSTDLSEAVNSQSSWRSCGESQGRFVANPLRCPKPVDKGVMKLKKAWRFDVSEDEDEDSGRWESEMTQERELADYDDWDGDKVFLSSSPSTSGENNDTDSWEESGDNKGDGDDMLEKTDAEFESMVYETTGFDTEEPGGSSFMEVDPIPIPGPPGSFLESPWDMGTDATATENHGNFCQVQTCYNQLDLITDKNLSESPVSAVSNFAAPETQTFSLSNIVTTDNDQSCCCQREENALEDTTFRQPPPPHNMIHQDLLSKSAPALPSNSGPVLRLMGKDLMVINQREETSHENSIPKPTSQFQNLSKTQQQVSPYAHLHRPYGGSGLYFNTSASFYNTP
ncbi:hapless 8 [Raphanus sativus]|nr:hapless 8 [Raphanus sativus]